MIKNEVKEILKRINSNYPEFVIDEYKQNEWYKELKDYSYEDVMNKLEQHMRSADYGAYAPKLYFLTKFLTKESEKGKHIDYNIECRICKKYVNKESYDEHYERCLDVEYITKIRKKYFNQIIGEDKKEIFRKMNKDTFDVKYLQFLNDVYNDVLKEEQERINKIINPAKIKFDLGSEENV